MFQVGDLTGVFLAHLDESSALKAKRWSLPSFRRSPRKLNGFVLADKVVLRGTADLTPDKGAVEPMLTPAFNKP